MADRSSAGIDVTFRLASHEDYEAVMRISEGVLGNRDYLPAFFHRYIDDPDVVVFLALVGDQVVGLKAAILTEGGTAFIVKAARVAPDWRGQGIDGKLSGHQDEWLRQNRPAVRYKRATAFAPADGSNSVAVSILQKKMRLQFSMPFIEYQCGPDLWWRQDPAQLAQLDTTGLPDVVPLQDADDDFCTAVQKCFPAEACGSYDGKPIILVDWNPFNLCPTNLKRLQDDNTIYVLRTEGETSLSLSNTYPSPTVRMLCCQIYASNMSTVLKHILKHLQNVSRDYPTDSICVSVFVPQYELEDSVHDFFRDTLQMEHVHPCRTEGLVFESEL